VRLLLNLFIVYNLIFFTSQILYAMEKEEALPLGKSHISKKKLKTQTEKGSNQEHISLLNISSLPEFQRSTPLKNSPPSLSEEGNAKYQDENSILEGNKQECDKGPPSGSSTREILCVTKKLVPQSNFSQEKNQKHSLPWQSEEQTHLNPYSNLPPLTLNLNELSSRKERPLPLIKDMPGFEKRPRCNPKNINNKALTPSISVRALVSPRPNYTKEEEIRPQSCIRTRKDTPPDEQPPFQTKIPKRRSKTKKPIGGSLIALPSYQSDQPALSSAKKTTRKKKKRTQQQVHKKTHPRNQYKENEKNNKKEKEKEKGKDKNKKKKGKYDAKEKSGRSRYSLQSLYENVNDSVKNLLSHEYINPLDRFEYFEVLYLDFSDDGTANQLKTVKREFMIHEGGIP
jgi:hypothetical protein